MLRIVLSIFLAACSISPLSAAQKRVALVIGNAAYKHTTQLANPKNDAADLAALLKEQGFEVITGTDLDKAEMDRTIKEFSAALSGAETGIFFYAGHGLQVGGVNYLVPIDAQLTTVAALDWEMVRLDLVQRTMERDATTNILFLDACRNNPLARNLARALGTRSADIGRGLAATESGIGTLISFSTQPGNVALDGTGRNSPFAAALVRNIKTSTDSITDLLVSVRNDVMRATDRKQVPWEHSALTGRFYFKEPGPAPDRAALSWMKINEYRLPARITIAGDWGVELAQIKIPENTEPWFLGVVLRVNKKDLIVGIRPSKLADGTLAELRLAVEVLHSKLIPSKGATPKVGDVVWVAPVDPQQPRGDWMLRR